MNYRHAFHAGNFADLFKHALLLELMEPRRDAARPLTVIDTHAGAGVYDLTGDAARATGEGSAAGELMRARDAPQTLRRLQAAIGDLNGGDHARLYPGSPWLIGSRLRPPDRAIACERRADEAAALRRNLVRWPAVEAVCGDGWDLAARRAPRAPARLIGRLLRVNPGACVAVWAPIKDLASFDALAARIEDAASPRPLLVAETRLRALGDPTRLNGCAVLVANPPVGFEAAALETGRWIADRLGDVGGGGQVRTTR
jgi:23S rRNA (adenine2030-N6)-methyltransferase